MNYVLFFYTLKTETIPADSYTIPEEMLGSLGFVTSNWLKMHPRGYVRAEVSLS